MFSPRGQGMCGQHVLLHDDTVPVSWSLNCCAAQPAPTTETEVFLTIFDYIDRLFAMVRPRKLLHMAIGELT